MESFGRVRFWVLPSNGLRELMRDVSRLEAVPRHPQIQLANHRLHDRRMHFDQHIFKSWVAQFVLAAIAVPLHLRTSDSWILLRDTTLTGTLRGEILLDIARSFF